ncbi:endonuclease/exonuclease/phosphatase family protein [Gilliamella sp. B3464]|uniref:endonuclease/exonuclease/phosphatase family protein n=1 Tax=unclassified Gilliamella TaxID=2685620 RepID=UPI00226AA5D4|nr:MULTISPECIES: endonuclease/exonuclease/phosphatase family protein [unclassified Gilliamella]MCX8712129.1 endonuclease/exonuclease/phosphatase family protein [Gilliamella sp. B3468]MCX8751326.1 endonuclease/exonuclease/phosphatase family protein [Gilliamella sp. B3464]
MFKNRDYTLRYQGNNDVELILPNHHIIVNQPLIDQNSFSVLVWNIFKQKRADCIQILEQYAKSTKIILLQEAQTTPQLLNFVAKHNKIADHVPAYCLNDIYAGVMTITDSLPTALLSFKEREPLIRVPKSALITYYPIEHSLEQLLVANIHAINFSLGVKVYRQQMFILLNRIKEHHGPVILAGDFNAWSRQRLNLLYHLIRSIGLKPVNFSVDIRKTFMGRPLDFIFYRGLQLDAAEIISTTASDHNPLLVNFRLGLH